MFCFAILAAVTGSGVVALADAFYRSGALVFGGGHVVLPLLQGAVVETGWVSPDAFLAGYGLFRFSAEYFREPDAFLRDLPATTGLRKPSAARGMPIRL